MSDLYRTGAYAEENPDWHEADARQKARTLTAVARFAGLSPHTVADVGCGTGRVLYLFKRALDEEWPETIYEGFDIAPIAIARARSRYEGDRIAFVEGDFRDSERRVDLLLCVDVIEHIADDRAFLDALLPRAAWFLFRIPLDLSALDVLKPARLLRAQRQYGHRHFYTREIALALLIEAGYHIEVVRYDRIVPQPQTLRQKVTNFVRQSAFQLDADGAVRALGGFSLVVCARAERT